MNMLISTRSRILISPVVPSETGKSQPTHVWLEVGTLQPKYDKVYFFIIIQGHSTILAKKLVRRFAV